MFAGNVGPGGPKKSTVISTMAAEGPAAKKLQKNMAKQTSTTMYSLYDFPLAECQ